MGRSGRITLRTSSEIHEQLARIASDLGLDINGVLNLMLRRELGPLTAEGAAYRHYRNHAPYIIPLSNAWRAKHPGKTPRDFLTEFRKYMLGEPSTIQPPEEPR